MKEKNMNSLQRKLFELQDLKYRNFHSKLMPGIDKETIIGIRTPVLRKFAKEFAKTEAAEAFLKELPHQYYEENNLHMLLISDIKDYERCLAEVKRFLPYINNWATCDIPRPKCFAKNKAELLPVIKEWIASGDTYTIRYGIGTLMSFYLDEGFQMEDLDLAAGVRREEYYVKMMAAWYFATALAKQYDAALPYLRQRRLDRWTHNKTIQKAVESYRITPEQKDELRSLRWKDCAKEEGV